MRRAPVRIAALFAAGFVALAGAANGWLRPSLFVVDRFVLPRIPLRAAQPTLLDDRGIVLGGIGSDLWRAPEDPPGEFYMVTDRGPNGEVDVLGKKRRTFLVPDFAPMILKVRARDGLLEIEESIVLKDPFGKPLSGLSNESDRDETPYDHDGASPLRYDRNGVDTEGLVRLPDGSFFVAEEYAPSLLHVAADGSVIERFVPHGTKQEGATVRMTDALPAILSRRSKNRGFEALALDCMDPRGITLYAAMQSPLANPDSDTAKNSRNTRILAFDVARGEVTAEYVFRFADWKRFDPRARSAADLKIGALACNAPGRLLVLERTDEVARLVEVEIDPAKSILGGDFDGMTTRPTLEQIPDTERAGVPCLVRHDLARLDPEAIGSPRKIEGIAIVDDHTIAISNDDDFGVGEATSDASAWNREGRSEIVYVRIPFALR